MLPSSPLEMLEAIRRYALPSPGTAGSGTWLRQRGEIRLGQRWFQFTAEQHVDAVHIGFTWKASVRVAPFISITVLDSLVAGCGGLKARLFLLPVMSTSGPDVNTGQVLRFLAELPWCPLALENPSLEWSALDQRTLRVRLVEGSGPASLTMRTDGSGRVLRCEAKRPRQVGKQFVLTDWLGEFADYRELGGMRIPTRAEVSWTLPKGTFTYWRGEVLDAGITR